MLNFFQVLLSSVWRSLCLIGVTAFLLSGCAGLVQKPVLTEDDAYANVIENHLQRNYNRLRTLNGRGQLVVQSPRQSFRGGAHVLLKKPDSLYVKLEAMLGMDVGVLFADRYEFFIYSPMDNMVYTSTEHDTLRLGMFLGFDMSRKHFLQAITGMPKIEHLSDLQLSVKEEEWLLVGYNNEYLYKHWLDPQWGVITKTEVRDRTNNLIRIEEFSRFVKINNVRIPQTIRYIRPQEKESLTMFYETVHINTKIAPKKFYIKMPPDVFKFQL